MDPSTTERAELLWIGTATVLLCLGSFTVLTDPNFLHAGDHARLGWGLRSARVTQPALEIGALPPLDLVVLSHHHGDHFDDVAARELDRTVPIVSTDHAVRKLRRQGFQRSDALATWGSTELSRGDQRLRVTAMPGKHAPSAMVAVDDPAGDGLDARPARGRRAAAARLHQRRHARAR
jgi:L-ascorbate metabolism protein UlaG (beta-lactamase superfamily)